MRETYLWITGIEGPVGTHLGARKGGTSLLVHCGPCVAVGKIRSRRRPIRLQTGMMHHGPNPFRPLDRALTRHSQFPQRQVRMA